MSKAMLKIMLEQGHRQGERLRRNVYMYEARNFSALGLSAPHLPSSPPFSALLPPPAPNFNVGGCPPQISMLEDVHEHVHKNMIIEVGCHSDCFATLTFGAWGDGVRQRT